jgi:hypothetical protein
MVARRRPAECGEDVEDAMSIKQHIDLKEIAGLFPRSRPHLFESQKMEDLLGFLALLRDASERNGA